MPGNAHSSESGGGLYVEKSLTIMNSRMEPLGLIVSH